MYVWMGGVAKHFQVILNVSAFVDLLSVDLHAYIHSSE